MKHTLHEMQEIAALRGGKCFAKEYLYIDIALPWMCGKGHTWDATPFTILQGAWCPKCAKEDERRQKQLELMQEIAEQRGGKCLSENYTNCKTKLEWQCREGHRWFSTPDNVKSGGYWCPYCSGKFKHNIEEMQEIAKERGGLCLSEIYLSSKKKLQWQ